MMIITSKMDVTAVECSLL